MMIASTARISNIFVADMPKNIRLTGFGVSAFEVESVTPKREAYTTQAQEAFGTSQRPSVGLPTTRRESSRPLRMGNICLPLAEARVETMLS